MTLSTDIATIRALKANVETLSELNINQGKTIEEKQKRIEELERAVEKKSQTIEDAIMIDEKQQNSIAKLKRELAALQWFSGTRRRMNDD